MSEITKIKGVLAGKRLRDLQPLPGKGFRMVFVDDDGKEFVTEFIAGVKIVEFDGSNLHATANFAIGVQSD